MRRIPAADDAPPDITVIVVSYETRDMTLACLRSIVVQAAAARYELIVLDNASTDGSAAAIRAGFPERPADRA